MIMEKYIIIFKRLFITTGLLSILLIVIELIFKISFTNTNGLYIACSGLILILFSTSIYSFFILSDIKKKKFIYLRSINYILLITSFLFFIYWGILYPNALAFLYPSYLAILTIFNLIVMSVIYYLQKTGGRYFFKDWLLFIVLIAFYILFVTVKKS